MNIDDAIQLVTYIGGAGGVGWMTMILTRKGQAEEHRNARQAAEAAARLQEAQDDREALKTERDENDRLRKIVTEQDERLRKVARDHAEQNAWSEEQHRKEMSALRTGFQSSLAQLTDDVATLREVARIQVRQVADGEHPSNVTPTDLTDEFGL